MLIDLVNQPNREIEKTYPSLKRVGGTLFGESHHPDMGGDEVYLAGAARPLIDAGVRAAGAVESLCDITGIKKKGRALEADRDWLEQRVSERTAPRGRRKGPAWAWPFAAPLSSGSRAG